MRRLIHLDTHVAIWLYARQERRLSATAKREIARRSLFVSPFVLLELTMLYEIGKLPEPSIDIFGGLATSFDVEVLTTPTRDVVEAAEKLAWTRDMNDRLIVAHAVAERADILTADATIRQHYPPAIW